MKEYANDYTKEEQIVTQIARSFRPEDDFVVSGVTNTALVGLALAQKLYAPRLLLWMEAWGRGGLLSNVRFPFMIGQPPDEFLEATITSRDIFDFGNKGKWCILMQPVQIDKFGNSNLSLVGDKKRPKAVFVGPRGVPDNTVNGAGIYYVVPDHAKRVFVEKVDYICGIGYGSERKEGTVKWGAPSKVFSNLGVFDFEEDTGLMRLQSVLTGVTVEEVVKNTGFGLVIPDSLAETEPPTKEEIQLIREVIDPAGISRLDYLRGDEYKKLFADIMKGTTYQKLYGKIG